MIVLPATNANRRARMPTRSAALGADMRVKQKSNGSKGSIAIDREDGRDG